MTAGRGLLFPLIVLFAVLPGAPAPAAGASPSLAEISRLVAADRLEATETARVVRSWASLGMRVEAALFLEKRLGLGDIPPESAVPLFEEVVAEQARWNRGDRLAALCEIALRNGAATATIWYAYGTGLRASGRLPDSLAAFGRIEPDSPLFPYAAFAIGQVASEEGDDDAARDAFRRAGELLDHGPPREDLRLRLVRSKAELLLATGFPAEALSLFESVPRTEDDSPARFATAEAAGGSSGTDNAPSAEFVERLPVRRKVLFLLLRGGLSRERGDFRASAESLAAAERALSEHLSSESPPVFVAGGENEEIDRLNRLIDLHATIRSRLLDEIVRAGDPAAIRNGEEELLLSLLLLDRSIQRIAAEMKGEAPGAYADAPSAPETEETVRRIERAALDGFDAEGRVETIAKRMEVLENLAHPIRRYRLLSKVEKFQAEIDRMKREIRGRRDAVPAEGEGGGAERLSGFFEDMGRFLTSLEEFRKAETEARDYIDAHFDIFRKGTGDSSPGPAGRLSETVEFDGRRFSALLSRARELQDRARRASWAREKQALGPLRPVVLRQLADALVGYARTFRARPWSEWPEDRRTALEKAVTLLGAGGLTPRDRTEAAVNIASLLLQKAEGAEWSRGGRSDPERAMIDAVLPALDPSAVRGARREEALYLAALLRMETGDPAGLDAAREFLERFPGTDSASDLAVRLGHEALAAGNASEAESYYRRASAGSNLPASAIARHQRGWILLQKGDAAGALREASPLLAAPSFPCEDRSPVEESLVRLATRSLERSAPETLLAYAPVRNGGCLGKALLLELAKRHEARGDAVRASSLYAALAERYPEDEDALAYERKTIRGLIAIGEEEQALGRARSLGERYGPASEWARRLPERPRGKAPGEIREILRELAERSFDEGIRSGKEPGMKAAADLLERLFALEKGGGPHSGDRDLRLKWAVASLKSGAEDRGMAILEGLLDEGRTDEAGRKAAVLFLESMLSGYERGTRSAEDVTGALERLLRGFPSRDAAESALRASAAFLKAGDYGPADRAAEEAAKSPRADRKVRVEATLVRSRAAIFLSDFERAGKLADSILGDPGGEGSRGSFARAKELVLLSALKEIEVREAAGEWGRAASLLEGIGRRFADAPETSLYLRRAARAYRVAGDKEGAERVGRLFLKRFPGKEECLEIAGMVGAFLEERGKLAEAADLYAAVADRFPRRPGASGLLFRAAGLSQGAGDRDLAKKRFHAYRARYSDVRWRTAYATLSVGLLLWTDGDREKAVRELGAGLKRLEAGVEPGADPRILEIAGKANIAIGEYWADRFRKTKLVLPLDKSLKAKGSAFRKSLAAFERAERDAPAAVAAKASQLTGDLFVDFGDSLLSSQRPKGMTAGERARYEEGLRSRAGAFFERALDRYTAVLRRIDGEAGLGEYAAPLRRRIERAKSRLAASSG